MSTYDYKTTWKMQNKQFIKIKDMGDSHLRNTIDMLKRKGLTDLESPLDAFIKYPPPNGDMALMAWENEFNNLTSVDRKPTFHPCYKYLLGEYHRRGLRDAKKEKSI